MNSETSERRKGSWFSFFCFWLESSVSDSIESSWGETNPINRSWRSLRKSPFLIRTASISDVYTIGRGKWVAERKNRAEQVSMIFRVKVRILPKNNEYLTMRHGMRHTFKITMETAVFNTTIKEPRNVVLAQRIWKLSFKICKIGFFHNFPWGKDSYSGDKKPDGFSTTFNRARQIPGAIALWRARITPFSTHPSTGPSYTTLTWEAPVPIGLTEMKIKPRSSYLGRVERDEKVVIS